MKKSISYLLLLLTGTSLSVLHAQGVSPRGSNSADHSVPQSALTTGFKSTVFYALYDDVSPTPAQIDWTAFNRIIVFGTSINTTTPPFLREAGNISPSDSANFDGGYNKKINWIKAITDSAHAHGCKVYFSVNAGSVFGVNQDDLTNNVANRRIYEHYVAGAGGWMARRHLDGIYFDYEYPNGADTSFKSFVNELRDTMSTWTAPLVGVDVPNYWEPVFADTAWANNQLDQIDIMAYGFDDGSSVVGFNSPLFQDFTLYPNYNGTSWFGDTRNGQGVYIGWINHGIAKSRLGVIIPFEMRSAVGVNAPGQSGHASSFTYYSDVLNAISAAAALGVSPNWDAAAQVPWLGYTDGSGTKHFYSYENQASINAKVDTLINGGFSGVGVWHLGIGYASNANPPDQLLQWVKSAVGGAGTLPPDTIKPVVALTSPANGDSVAGNVTVNVTATDNVSIASVQLIVNGAVAATDFSAPYSFTWNTIGLNGPQTLAAKAIDGSGNSSTTPTITVFVVTDNIKPVVTLIAPANGDTVSGATILSATATDNMKVANVQFLVNGSVVGTVTSAPYSFAWNTLGLTGQELVAARASDPSGNVSTTPSVSVTVIAPPGVPSLWVYQDSLVKPWRDTSWGALNNYKSTEQVYAGTYAIKTVQSAWGAYSARSGTLSSPVHVVPQQYSELQFSVYNTTPGLVLNVYCYNDHGDVFPNILQESVPLNQWSVISVPMNQLDPNNYVIDRICIQNYTPSSSSYYLDNILFVTAVPLPSAPSPVSPANGLTVQVFPVTLSWTISANASNYYLQVATDSLFGSIIYSDSTLATTSGQLPALTSYTYYYWRVSGVNIGGRGPWSSTSMFRFVTYTHWDMVSLPLRANDPRSHSVYPTAISEAFDYTPAGYIIVDTLVPGNGYWMKFGSDETLVATGPSILADTIDITAGWNLIGSISVPIDVNTLASIPPGITISNVFGYSPVYTITDSIRPGRGYWLRASAAARLILAAPSHGIMAGRVSFETPPDLPPPPPAESGTIRPIPRSFALDQNYPNPFNPSTVISFAIPTETFVSLKIYDVLGNEVATVVNERRPAGYYHERFSPRSLASGLYFYRLATSNFMKVEKMLYLK
ncbi:MAG TPA: Ig-like domain-containing protein [Bacteroidota bacterium]|nr:Ig-like domain-containing protein [Bacteroidota bacterium]